MNDEHRLIQVSSHVTSVGRVGLVGLCSCGWLSGEEGEDTRVAVRFLSESWRRQSGCNHFDWLAPVARRGPTETSRPFSQRGPYGFSSSVACRESWSRRWDALLSCWDWCCETTFERKRGCAYSGEPGATPRSMRRVATMMSGSDQSGCELINPFGGPDDLDPNIYPDPTAEDPPFGDEPEDDEDRRASDFRGWTHLLVVRKGRT